MRPTVGFALCGSFCTFRKAIDALRALTAQYTVVPIFSDAAWETDTRFGASADFRAEVTALCGTEPLLTHPVNRNNVKVHLHRLMSLPVMP